MLRFEIDVTASDTESRVIEGIAVPYGEAANLGGENYRFEKGSLRAARPRTPLLLGHDMAKPVGILAGITDTDQGAIARFKIDDGPDGDLALIQAQSGSRGGLSIGATIVAAELDDAGVNIVSEASLFEISLVSVSAFASADVLSVAAEAAPESTNEPETPAEEENTMEPTEAPEPVAAELPAEIVVKAEHAPMPTLDEYVIATLRMQQGDQDAATVVRAALSNSATTDVPGVLPPAYVNEILHTAIDSRPIANAIRRRALPPVGTSVIRPTLTTGPDGATAANLDAIATSNKVVIGQDTMEIDRWDWAGSASVAVIERSGIDYVSFVLSQALVNMHADLEGNLAGMIMGMATSGGATHTATTIGGAIGKVYTNLGQPADTLVCGPEFYGALLDARGTATFSDGSASADLGGNVYGLKLVCSPFITAGKAYAIASGQVELWESNPVRLTANAIGAMQIEFGVVSFYAEWMNADSVCEVSAAPTVLAGRSTSTK